MLDHEGPSLILSESPQGNVSLFDGRVYIRWAGIKFSLGRQAFRAFARMLCAAEAALSPLPAVAPPRREVPVFHRSVCN